MLIQTYIEIALLALRISFLNFQISNFISSDEIPTYSFITLATYCVLLREAESYKKYLMKCRENVKKVEELLHVEYIDCIALN